MSASQPMDSENKTSHSLDSSFPVGLNEELSFLNESRRPEDQPRSQAFVGVAERPQSPGNEFAWRRINTIELLHIECVLLYPVSQKSVSTKWRIYKGKINSPQDFLL